MCKPSWVYPVKFMIRNNLADKYRGLLEPGDVDEGLRATPAPAIGDDRLLKRAGRRIRPELFTHGSYRSNALFGFVKDWKAGI